jgi:dUTP pyrophosphatase
VGGPNVNFINKGRKMSECDCKCDYPPLEYFKIHSDSQDLEFGTEGAACFDVASYLRFNEKSENLVKGFDKNNKKIVRPIIKDVMMSYSDDPDNGFIIIEPKDRLLIPSGLILSIPDGYSVRTHPRSSTGYKIGIHPPHDQGIVDSDYYHELFLLFYNMTEVDIVINHNQKIVQSEMIKKPIYQIKETNVEPSQKTDRVGGFGSTDKK